MNTTYMPSEQCNQLICELFQYLELPVDQDAMLGGPVGLLIDDSYSIYFESIAPDTLLLEANLGSYPEEDLAFSHLCLKHNQISSDNYQPIVSLTEDQQLVCWLKLSLPAADLSVLLSAFDEVLALSETLLTASTHHQFPEENPRLRLTSVY
ncbi:CesT family type III secretion system chaperone [Iodobacter fluviatilis]|uniref:Tir chaperone family protein CesT n=1 Tax=Iodobacter fluviatilis TaxID=537 RepID=A0A377Q5T7_9NEIS|nr:CesT family type III secretion system chaperone [Iodobacter fluviatilis]TCU80228.1 Tir chaperone family protein CesT [Iodobacter fluviatilis]STQ90115.1 Tir chaperone protein (CesT) [Iodobacter fluviatilis]